MVGALAALIQQMQAAGAVLGQQPTVSAASLRAALSKLSADKFGIGAAWPAYRLYQQVSSWQFLRPCLCHQTCCRELHSQAMLSLCAGKMGDPVEAFDTIVGELNEYGGAGSPANAAFGHMVQ